LATPEGEQGVEAAILDHSGPPIPHPARGVSVDVVRAQIVA